MPLRRSKSSPMDKTRSLAGSARAKGSMAKQRAARKTAQSRARTNMARHTVVSAATTAAAVRQIVLDAKEDKYMNCAGDLVSGPLAPTTGSQAVSVAAFATTATMQTGQVNPVTYCGRAITNLHMLRPFNTADAVGYQSNLIDGAEALPTVSKTQWLFQRMGVSQGKASWGDPMKADLYQTCPIRCRIIRVTPKLQAGVTTAINPTQDLFLNQYGVAYGANDNAFTLSDAESAMVNHRVYHCLADDQFTLDTAPAVYYAMTAPPDAQGNNEYNMVVQRSPGKYLARRNYHHQLAAKRGGSVRYELPQAITTTNADTGHRREYIFCHFWYEAADAGSGITVEHPPGGNTAGVFKDIRLHIRSVSKFKDV
ncbi:MAG: putative capsid protein [Cressdnaviricota sp.]|nr:MAG: putative capsid protein [Cressdnaviricota sp.]